MKPLAVVKNQDVINHVSLCCLAVHIAIMVALFCNVTKKEGGGWHALHYRIFRPVLLTPGFFRTKA